MPTTAQDTNLKWSFLWCLTFVDHLVVKHGIASMVSLLSLLLQVSPQPSLDNFVYFNSERGIERVRKKTMGAAQDKEGRSQGPEHTGHIDCRCGHQKNDTADDLRRHHRIHLNSACFWSCCGARWDDLSCKVCKERVRHPSELSCARLESNRTKEAVRAQIRRDQSTRATSIAIVGITRTKLHQRRAREG